jgi:asparagine synthase (glutamine-hydrolysing)
VSAIAGLWSFDGNTDVSAACRKMLAALSVYGSHDSSQYSSPNLAMGRCLLRLLPEDRFDRQPLSAGAVTALAADLRLDNREELARTLGIASAAAAVMADSDILLAAWQRWGEHCVEHLIGAFSFAIWNGPEQQLFLARDHTGERPLYYSTAGGCFAFASMPKGLHPLPFVQAEVDEDYIARYLALVYMPIERTIFERIERLPAGCMLSVRMGQNTLRRYWDTTKLPQLQLNSDEEYLELFRERFDEAVRSRLRTVGQVGAQLSGGLDSSSVAATAALLLEGEGRELTAYTAVPRPGFNGMGATHFDNEGPAAAEIAALYSNMRHLLVESSQTSFLDVLDLNNSLYDHPCYGPNNEVWSNAIMTRAREDGVTVLLNGNCGNSTFSYNGMPVLSAWLRSGQWLTLARVAREIRATRDASVKSMLRHALWPSLPFWLRKATDPHIRGFSLDYCALHPEVIDRLDLKRQALHDLNTGSLDGRPMLNALLRFGDVSETSIAPQGGWQLDFRDPTFDKRVVEFCLTVPLEQFVRNGKLRSLARRAMAGRLPATTLDRPQRGRQSADWHVSMSAVRERMLKEIDRLESSPLPRRMLDLERMRRLVENWPTGGFEQLEVEGPYHAALTRGFSVGSFLYKYDPARARDNC